MDPELQELLRRVRLGQQQQMDPAEIDRSIGVETGGRYSNVDELIAAVTQPVQATYRGREVPAGGPEAEALARQNERGASVIGDVGRMFAEGATAGHVDELVGLLGAIPGGRTGREARAASQQRVADIRTLNPGAATAADLAGTLATGLVGGLPLRAALKGSQVLRAARAPAAVRAGIEAALAAPRAGTTGRALRAGGRVVGMGAARGAGAGALIGGIEGAGRSDADSFGAYALGGADDAALGGLFGAGAGLIGSAKAGGRAVADIRRLRMEHLNDRIAQQGRDLVAGNKTSREILDEVAQRRTMAQEGFRDIEDIQMSSQTFERVLKQDIVLDVAESPDGGRLRQAISRYNDPSTPKTFAQGQQVTTRMQDAINRLYRNGEGGAARELVAAKQELVGELDTLFPENPELRRVWRQTNYLPEMVESGRATRRLSARELGENLAAITDPEGRMAFQIGGVEDVLEQFEGQMGAVQLNTQMRARIDALLPDRAMADDFMHIIAEEAAEARQQKWQEVLVKWGSFMFGGSSIGAGIALGQ